MTLEEKIAMAQTIRSRDRFGPVSPEELAALPGTETEIHIPVEGGRTVHVYEERPDGLPAKAALVLNFHGGGFIKGRTDRDRRYCCTIMERLNALVWDVDYCVAPEAPFPAAVEETYGIIAYAFDHAEKLGVDPAKIILAGHSAGGNLVAAACLKNAESHRFSPCCVLMEYFPVDNVTSPVERRHSCGPTRSGSNVPRRKSSTPIFTWAMPILPTRFVRRSRQMRPHLPHSLNVLSSPQARIVCEKIQRRLHCV